MEKSVCDVYEKKNALRALNKKERKKERFLSCLGSSVQILTLF
jgi:hypothetical protein